ncbi:unnamed protein product [Nezara viridula]|uniref:Phosphatidylinositol-specific phospholipase C X domain-containing protein n=1 Tax=Nezara viridula TaxID=85310 RepID=A0A9P0E912_NEZVI|nr:unnamed protein product [Nezara viridula]
MFKVRTSLRYLCLIHALSFGSALDAANWMRDNIAWLGYRTLKQLCVPGTHNSGMNRFSGGTSFAKPCNTLNQSQSILKQLELGVRYLDIRPVIADGRLLTGHYTKIASFSWQGGNGQSMDSIVDEINSFTRSHNELIMISLSHALNTDVGNRYYRAFIKEEWDRLFRLLDRTKFLINGTSFTFFPWMTLSDLTKNGTTAAVLYTVDSLFTSVFVGKRVGYGFFYRNSLGPFNRFSDSNIFSTMFDDQIKKMRIWSKSAYFLLSWTLTQSPLDATLCPLRNSLHQLALEANKFLRNLLKETTSSAFPNIISLDFVETPLVTEVAIEVNRKVKY